jgi:hypothetical protein
MPHPATNESQEPPPPAYTDGRVPLGVPPITEVRWKITIDRGLDIFQKFESGPFSVEQAIQEARLTRGAEISYVRV